MKHACTLRIRIHETCMLMNAWNMLKHAWYMHVSCTVFPAGQASSACSAHLNLVRYSVSSLELYKGYNMLVCTHTSGRFKENLTNEIGLLKSWPDVQNNFLCVSGPWCSYNKQLTIKRISAYCPNNLRL